jgi:hypothetical protein
MHGLSPYLMLECLLVLGRGGLQEKFIQGCSALGLNGPPGCHNVLRECIGQVAKHVLRTVARAWVPEEDRPAKG